MLQFIGLDPGGETEGTGWCVMTVSSDGEKVETGVCSRLERTFAAVRQCIQGQLVGAGIDAPLYWCSGGDRLSDQRIRGAVVAAGGQSGTVSHVNSLRGACLVQGVLSAIEVQRVWPDAHITEAHPKALLRLSEPAAEFIGSRSFATLHERDALLAAYAARAHHERSEGWVDWFARESQPYVPGPYRVAYWFPECAVRQGHRRGRSRP